MKKKEKSLEDFIEFVLNKWKQKGTVTNEEESREYIQMMAILINNYIFTHLIATLCEMKDLYEEFLDE